MACSVTGKDKVGPAKRCFLGVFVCVYVSRREKEVGRGNGNFTPFLFYLFYFASSPPPLSLSFFFFLFREDFFLEGLFVVMKSPWLEKDSKLSLKFARNVQE